MSPRQSVPIIPAIVEVYAPFKKEQDKVSVQSVCSRRKSSIFEEIIIPDPLICGQLLDIISEDEYMIKESPHFILSEHQLIKVIAYTFDVVENQVVLNTEDKGRCDKFILDDIDKVDFLKDSYKLCLQKPEANEIFDTSADKSDTYTKTETDVLLEAKVDKSELIDSYSKTEDDALLLVKANVADLTNYVDLNSAQTITGQKQFGVISVSSEVRDIVIGRQKVYVFSTQGELNDWMAVQDNVEKLVIGDNLYIIDKEVTDYWWDGTNLKVLQTELPDMSNVVTSLGPSLGLGNAITDISIDGNVLTPAKNKNFVDTYYDQSISGQKTFNTTIHSVGIIFQTYDNSSIVCAIGGIRSIADIQSASYIKSEDDTLLLLKADKTYLIDSYTKGETNSHLNNKAETRVSYSKGEDNALLLLKDDKTLLIDSYTNSEINNLINNNADTGVSYIKDDNDDALLLLKADKTQLIESYTKTETNNFLDNKAKLSTTYIKTETDQIFSKIDVRDVDLIEYYNKTKTDEILGEKADSTKLSNYMTLGTAQTINANKTFHNSCRFVSSIDGMSTVTGLLFVKSSADDIIVLLEVDGTKSPSEFTGTPTDLSNYYNKSETYLRTEIDNKYVRFEGSIQQTKTG
ncbi:MAG: hypothetical protein EZS28_001801 [Streblomastix strix]|uniref:Uncharacterized protein n=1 Tax=Streblomastix strix TaxID=222440 RepID=A0A5J4X632_9EUKA|nr:MAG: hypothetical protein EZS28_001801 [Streblomastix strix]